MHSRKSALVCVLAGGAMALALGLPAAQAAPAARATKVATTVQLTNVNPSDVDHVKFTGKVKSKKAVCAKRRTVKLKQVDQNLNAGKARSNSKGVWKVSFDGNKIHPGKFRMSVVKKVTKKGGKRIVCKATSKTVSVTG